MDIADSEQAEHRKSNQSDDSAVELELLQVLSKTSSYDETELDNFEKYKEDEFKSVEEAEQYEQMDSGPVEITEKMLKQIQQELCLVRLSWPNIDYSKDVYLSTLPSSYKYNSDKEKLLLWYAESFRKQYNIIYSDRKPLLLACDNECGIQKFVSTTIRRSTLPYPELYTWQGCAKFVSDYLVYEPPKKALGMPECLRSPTWLLHAQRGNSFECATLLVSLLLGQGYNAFVVSGYASREQVLCDTTKRSCPYLPKHKKSHSPPPPKDTARYRLKPPPDLRSQFLLQIEARERQKIENDLQRQEEERQKMISELERPSPDKYWGARIHAWVVVLPERGGAREHEILKPFFIECSSGDSYIPTEYQTNLLYLGVESIWNDQNYWVNMQICSDGCASINWDLSKVELWEHLLPGEPWTMRGIEEEEADEDINIQQDKHLDMPFSYVEKINIPSLDFERRYPNGTKHLCYKKAKVELYAPYIHMDGLIERITVYDDYEYTTPTHIYKKYLYRADNLVECKQDFNDECVTDCYKRGRLDACKEHRYSTMGNDVERTLEFYDIVRLDGLSRIEMHPLYLTQHYVNREDLLYYRHVQYTTERGNASTFDTNNRVWKITEKYHRNEAVQASKDIAIREFAIGENEIRLKYHYEKGRSTRAIRTFIKPPIADRGNRLIFNPEMTYGYNPDPMSPPDKFLTLFYELDRQLKEEDQCLSFVRDAELEIATFLKIRATEYAMPKLTVSLFDRNRNQETKARMFAKEEMLRAQSEREVEEDVDYLGPYLARIGNPTFLSKFQAMQVRQECLNNLKQQLVDRANNILRAYEKCSQELKEKQAWLRQTEDITREQEERVLREINEMNFNLHAVEVRMNRYRDLVPERYQMMLNTLRQDPRLSILY